MERMHFKHNISGKIAAEVTYELYLNLQHKSKGK